MRGEVLLLPNAAAEGLISGDDGHRYRFSDADIASGHPVRGSQVDFVPDNSVATLIVVMEITPFNLGALPSPAPRLSPWAHFKRCCTTAYILGEGRAGMTEYWSFTLIHLAISLVFVVPFMAFALTAMLAAAATTATSQPPDAFLQILPLAFIGLMLPYLLISFALLPPTVTVQIRRLHDIGLSGWWYLIAFIPFGSIALFIMALMPTQPGSNRFGHPPL